MESKKFTKFELARMKRTAQNVEQFLQQKNKLEAKKAEIDEKLTEVLRLIELTDAPTKAMTGGYGTEDIIKKVVVPTDKLDKNGNVIKQTTFEFLYPDTIIPPVSEESVPEESVAEEVEEGTEEVVTGVGVADNTIY